MTGLEFWERFWMPSLIVLQHMERTGVLIDETARKAAYDRCSSDIADRSRSLSEWTNNFDRQHSTQINWSSTPQRQAFFYGYKRFPIPTFCGSRAAVRRNFDKKQTTDQVTIDTWIADETVSKEDRLWLSKYSEYAKAVKTAQFLVSLRKHVCPDGRIRAKFSPETDTGRLSSSCPNLQNIPKRSDLYGLRSCFVAEPGKTLVIADYSQLELFVLADFLVKRYSDESLATDLAGGDVHEATAKRCGVTRDQAKTINYAVNYGKTAAGLGAQILDADGLPIGRAAAQDLLDVYFDGYPGIKRFQADVQGAAKKNGYVSTLLGRRRYLPYGGNKAANSSSDRKAVNTPIQGSAAEIVIGAMLRLNSVDRPELKKYGWFNEDMHSTGANLQLQVHDELVWEVPNAENDRAKRLVAQTMVTPFRKYEFAVPLRVEVETRNTWGK